MADPEVTLFANDMFAQVDRIINSLQGLNDKEINQPPPVPESNSLLVLAVHTMANVQENVLEVIGGQDVGRDRDSEFRASGKSAGDVNADWDALKEQLQIFLNDTSPEMLNTEYEDPRRGKITGRGVLLQAATHAAEHAGHAELTRDWIVSQR